MYLHFFNVSRNPRSVRTSGLMFVRTHRFDFFAGRRLGAICRVAAKCDRVVYRKRVSRKCRETCTTLRSYQTRFFFAFFSTVALCRQRRQRRFFESLRVKSHVTRPVISVVPFRLRSHMIHASR